MHSEGAATLDFSCTCTVALRRLITLISHRGRELYGVIIRRWLLKQLHTDDTLDALALVVKITVSDKGKTRVAKELRRMAASLESTGGLRGWSFPQSA
jgi:hypothetical protein